MSKALVLGAAALALSANAASPLAVTPTTFPLYDYAGPALGSAPHGYGPTIYTAPIYAPTPSYPAPPAAPGYYAARPVVASQPLYDYAGYWGRDGFWAR
jgi:hypothetical protein